MARYHIGARAEYKLKHELEKHGWHVIRAAGSHGKWDLVAVRKVGGRVDVALIQVKRRRPPKKPSLSVYRNCSIIDCFVYFAPRKGAFLSKDWKFSVSDLDSIARPLQDGQPPSVCHQGQGHTKPYLHDSHIGSDHTHRRRACSRSTESSVRREGRRERNDESDRTQQGQ